jgi:hypothetical protein
MSWSNPRNDGVIGMGAPGLEGPGVLRCGVRDKK